MPVTNPPLGSIPLKRTAAPGSPLGSDYYRIIEHAYDPTTRTAGSYTPADSIDDSVYSKPEDEVVDRFCTAPSTPPYTERRYFHDGNGGVVFSDFDNVTACQLVCTLTLTLSASAMDGGRADVTAVIEGAQGAVELSLDNFATTGLAAAFLESGEFGYLFPALPAGTHEISAREKRAGGCTARATITLTNTYGLRYTHAYRDKGNAACLLEIFEREYTDDPEVIAYAQPNPVSLGWPGGGGDHVFTGLVRGSRAELALYLATQDQLLPLFSGDERLHQVRYSRLGVLQWKGYLLPEQYDVAFLSPPNTFGLSATDGLGTLSDIPFAGPTGQVLYGDWSMVRIACFCLDKLQLGLPLHTLFNLYPAGATQGASAIEQIFVDVRQYTDEKNKPWSCGRVLLEILTTFGCRLYQESGAWWLERLSELTTGPMTYRAFNAASTPLAPVTRTLLATVLPPAEGELFWTGASQRQNTRGAVSQISIAVEAGDEPANLLRFALPSNDDLPGAYPTSWTGFTTTPGTAYSQLLFQGRNKAPLLRLVGTTDMAALNDAKRLSAPWVQTPPTSPMSATLDDNYGGNMRIAFTAQPYGNTPNVDPLFRSQMNVAIKYGPVWLAPGGLFEQEDPPFLSPIEFPDDKAIKVSIGGWAVRTAIRNYGTQPVTVRLYAPVGGLSPATVEISEPVLTNTNAFGTGLLYTASYETNTGLLVSRTDTGTTLFHTDTPNGRWPGTLLSGSGAPVRGWFEPGAEGDLREAGDYLVRDRRRFQLAPAQVLTGVLSGPLGPGALLTDPNEVRPGVYVLTDAVLNTADHSWQVTAVQLLTLVAPEMPLPDNNLLHESDDRWVGEDGAYLLLENG